MIAYLRLDKLHEFDAVQLREIDAEALRLIDDIRNGDYTPKPSAETCGWCSYRTFCPASAATGLEI
ncbi:MAG: PD-(D/E)XK nuclease family protein [Chloracidobacterium sp.]|nr:PD-(D/E)XK nuclease family protein [Chloracidobacterium sp.]